MTRRLLLAAVASVVGLAAVIPATAQAFYFPGWPGSGIPPPNNLTPPGSNNPPSSRPPTKRPPDNPPKVTEPTSAVAGLIGLAMIGLRRVRRRK